VKTPRLLAPILAAALAFPVVALAQPFPGRLPTPEQIVAEMNRERAAQGLKPLQLNEKLNLAASDRIKDMFKKRYFDHVAPDGLDPFTWVEQRGYEYRSIGENIAIGYQTAAAIVDGWMTSPGHRQNILEKKYEEVGIAIAAGSPTPEEPRGPVVVSLYARVKPSPTVNASAMSGFPSLIKPAKKKP
jgi:uncharacterized protein YkwD